MFERGFVRKVRGSPAAIVAAHDVLAREPVDAVQIDTPDHLAALLAMPLLARIATLHLDHPLGDAEAHLLANAPLPTLRSLHLLPGLLTQAACAALGRAAWAAPLPALTPPEQGALFADRPSLRLL